MNAQKLLEQAKQRGIKVEVFEGKLSAVYPRGLHSDFIEKLRWHKKTILDWFAAAHLTRQIQSGEFDGCDRKTAKKIISILQASRHPMARRALEHLLHDA